MGQASYSELRNALEDLQAHAIDILMEDAAPEKSCVKLAVAIGQATAILNIPMDDKVKFLRQAIARQRGQEG